VGEEGRKRRLGFGKKGKSSFTVHRSEEVLPPEETIGGGRSGRQPSSASSDGEGSGDGDRSLTKISQYRTPHSISRLFLLYFPRILSCFHHDRFRAGASGVDALVAVRPEGPRHHQRFRGSIAVARRRLPARTGRAYRICEETTRSATEIGRSRESERELSWFR